MDLIAWLGHKKNPITQAIVSGLKDLNVPKRVADADPNHALQEIGFNAGQHSILNAMLNLEIVSSADEDVDLMDTKHKYLVEFEGYSEEEAKRITEKMESNDG